MGLLTFSSKSVSLISSPLSNLQDEASDLEDDDLSNLDSEEDEQTTNEQHIAELKALAEKDPEFFKYLQENDAELLDFGGEAEADEESEGEVSEDEEDSEDEDEEEEGQKKGKGKEKVVKALKATPILTKEVLKTWQRSLLEVSGESSLSFLFCVRWGLITVRLSLRFRLDRFVLSENCYLRSGRRRLLALRKRKGVVGRSKVPPSSTS